MKSLLQHTTMGPSGAYNVNCLFQHENVYISDNHVAAGWAWGQEVPKDDPFSVFHVDRHYDLLQSRLDEWVNAAPRIETLSFDDYLKCTVTSPYIGESQLFRWDNYFPIFVRQRETDLRDALFMTHEDGDKPWFHHKTILPTEHPENIPYWLKGGVKYIFNLDLDFFFLSDDEHTHRMYSDDYIRLIGENWRITNEKGLLHCTTIALSPEFCGGWEPSLEALAIFCDAAGLPIPAIKKSSA